MSEHAGWFDVWADDPEYPSSDWRAEVANDDTRLGYWQWVANQREMSETSKARG
jgi:hypothetical protein